MYCFLVCCIRVFKSARLIQDNNLVQGYEILGLSRQKSGFRTSGKRHKTIGKRKNREV